MPLTHLTYEPFEALDGRPHVVVDGPATTATTLCLSHWPGAPTVDASLQADLSAQMAFAYLDHPDALHGDAALVTNNHLDQDGLASLFALTEPEAALARRELLVDLAGAGDFATYRHRAAARASMVVSACTEPERTPFGPLPEDDGELTAHLYRELLPRVPELVERPEVHRELWADEDAQLDASEEAIASGEVEIVEHPDVELAVVTVHGRHDWSGHRFGGRRWSGVHPMAVNNATERVVILLVLPDGGYRLTHRYETWVTFRSRALPPRVDLVPLAEVLTASDDVTWAAERVDDILPTMAPVGGGSSLGPDAVTAAVVRHLRTAPPAFDAFRGGLLPSTTAAG
jgi:hypothetical protein